MLTCMEKKEVKIGPVSVQVIMLAPSILAVLKDADRPMYGMEIVEATGATQGGIYPALKKLERKGLVVAAWEDEKEWEAAKPSRPRRRYYSLPPEEAG